MKYEWRKSEKNIYLPKEKPAFINVPAFNYFTIEGEGNPNSETFTNKIQALYALSYGIRMSYKQAYVPKDYFEYTVYPLEGVWDLKDHVKERLIKNHENTFTKDDLKYKIMIRQPEFVTAEFAAFIKENTKKTKKIDLVDDVKFESIEEGPCVQMLHIGSYDDEIKSFNLMDAFCESQGYRRLSKIHREIYITNPNSVLPEKLKTVLRYSVTDNHA